MSNRTCSQKFLGHILILALLAAWELALALFLHEILCRHFNNNYLLIVSHDGAHI